jgi:hypothetical protein
MADDNAVVFAIGYLEGYINTCESRGIPNSDAASINLKTIEDAFNQYRQLVNVFRRMTLELKGKVDVASTL